MARFTDLLHHYVHKRSSCGARAGRGHKILIEEWRAAHERHGWAVGQYVIMPDHVHFFAGQSQVLRGCLNLSGRGKVGRVARSPRWVGRGQRPRLQHCGNASSLITFFSPMTVMNRNGITFSIIRFAREWFRQRGNGNTPKRLKR